MNRAEQYLAAKLNERTQAGTLRSLRTQQGEVDFYSNDYLGLVTTGALAQLMHPLLFGGTGSTGARLLSGNTVFAEALETRIAHFHKAEAALLFNSGYDANIGMLGSIAARNTTILYDELCHASIIDGIRLALCNHKFKYRHNDMADLERRLQQAAPTGSVIVVTESVFSMDGDIAPLAAIAGMCAMYDAQLVVDEAHATGVVGDNGEGLVAALGLEKQVLARVHTYGKAMGCHGAAIVGSTLLRDFLINFARSFIYTTALPGHSLQAISCAYDYLSSPSFSNQPLHDLIAHFRHKIIDAGMNGWIDSSSAIQALVVGEIEGCRKVGAALRHAGMQVSVILSPTVAAGSERLRICLHTYNTTEQIDRLFEILKTIKHE